MTDVEVMDRALGAAGLDDHQIDFMPLDEGGEVIAIGDGGEELVFTSFGIQKATHGLELAELESENFFGLCPSDLGWNECVTGGCAPQGSWRSEIAGLSRQMEFE